MHSKESLLSCVLSGQMSKDRKDQKTIIYKYSKDWLSGVKVSLQNK